jgi:hypothetical protein
VFFVFHLVRLRQPLLNPRSQPAARQEKLVAGQALRLFDGWF